MTIQAVERAFHILQAIDKTAEPARAAAIATQLNLPRTTVLRMLETLESLGAVQRLTADGRYQIGPLINQMGQRHDGWQSLKATARPPLQRLAEETGETVYLCVLAGHQIYYVDQIDSRHHILLRSWVGTYWPLHATAAGKLFLAHWPSADLDRYLAQPLVMFTPDTVVDPGAIRQYAAEIRRAGVTWTHGQTEPGLVGVAAPVYDPHQKVIAAVSLGGPSFRFPPPGQEKVIAEAVRRTAAAITELIVTL